MTQLVVVPYDGSDLADNALPVARVLAAAVGAELLLLTVSEPDLQAAMEDLLDRASTGIGEPARTKVVVGEDAAASIATAVHELGDVLVVMATHGHGGLRATVLGSVAEAVVRSLRAPVVVVGPHAGLASLQAGGKLVVFLDGSTKSEAILPSASALARKASLELWLVQVSDPDGEREREAAAPEDVVGNAYLREVAHRLEGEGLTVAWDTVISSHPGRALNDYLASSGAAMAAMTTHGRTGMARLTAGSVAAEIVRHSPVPVLLLRPDGLATE